MAISRVLDDESILRRAPFAAGRGYNVQEAEADAFAAAFLLPRWLVAWHCEQHGWNDTAFRHSENVYQLALRAGTSYAATCWTLLRYRIIDRTTANQLANIEPRAIKKNLLAGARPSNFFGDVWVLTDRDTGTRIEGGPSDLFVMRLTEHPGAGYLWRVEALDGDGFAVIGDARESAETAEEIGGPITRCITAQSRRRQSGELRLAESCPWQSTAPRHTFELHYDLVGAEQEGWSRAERRYRLEAA